MATDIYTKITELSEADEIKATDDFMISRPTGNGNNYVSFKCGYEQLSSSMRDNVLGDINKSIEALNNLRICTSVNDLRDNGTRLVSEGVIKYISDNTNTGMSGAGLLRTNTSSPQEVTGPVTFRSLKCQSPEIYSDDDAVNYAALQNYVSTAGMMPFFKGCSGIKTGLYRPDPKKDLYAILHPIPYDCIAQVTLHSTQNYPDFCIFAYCMTCHSYDTLESMLASAQKEIDNGEIEDSNYCVMDHINLQANKPVIVNLPMRKENILAFFAKGTYNADTGIFKPDKNTKIAKNKLTISVVEYRSFTE